MTRLTVLRVFEIVTILTIDTLITKLALIADRAITEILALLEQVGIVTILIIITLHDQITIFEITSTVGKVTIFQGGNYPERDPRRLALYFFELFKKWPSEINILTKVSGVPTIPPPSGGVIDWERNMTIVLRNNLLTTKITFPIVETLHIALHHPTMHATTGTSLWLWHLKKIIKFLVFGSMIKYLFTVCACSHKRKLKITPKFVIFHLYIYLHFYLSVVDSCPYQYTTFK